MSEELSQPFRRNYGTDPHSLVSQIVRDRVYTSRFWKEQCFALNAESVLDLAKDLDNVGFCCGGYSRPTKFFCLLMKLLQISPSQDIVQAYFDFSTGAPTNDSVAQLRDLRYMRALAAAYVRIVASPQYVYKMLEPLLCDYRKINVSDTSGQYLEIRMDEWVSMLLDQDYNSTYGFHFPTLPRRIILQARGILEEYESSLSI